MPAISARSIRRHVLHHAPIFVPFKDRLIDDEGRTRTVTKVSAESRGARLRRKIMRAGAVETKNRAAEEKAKRRQAGRDLIAALKAAGLPCPGHPDHVRLAS
jgi:hypothetical protein